ncbi:MAG TPA: hypothetical protein VNJ08_05400 [Bacteriovoracaceae bacterium]|nr:hypothetical protein [Bacteriovoracaceae bacterium]
MKFQIVLLIILMILTSCSSVKKSLLYGGMAGAAIGVIAGSALSPDPESKAPNMAVWGSLGLLAGAGLGYFFHMDDPENRELPSMILPSGERSTSLKGKLDEAIVFPSESKKFKVETGPLPNHLKDKVKNPYIIEHTIPERVEEMKNGKTITIEAHKAWEVSFE